MKKLSYREIVILLLKQQKVSNNDVLLFITEYIKSKKGKDPTAKELDVIRRLINNRVFNIEYAINEASKDLNLQVVKLKNLNTNQILRIDVYG